MSNLEDKKHSKVKVLYYAPKKVKTKIPEKRHKPVDVKETQDKKIYSTPSKNGGLISLILHKKRPRTRYEKIIRGFLYGKREDSE